MGIGQRAAIASAGLGLVGLVGAAGAGSYVLARSVDVPRGGNATFLPSRWRCNNFGSRVECFSGDAYPYVVLTGTAQGGITVKVHTLRDPQGGHLTRTYEKGLPVYIFTAM